MRPGDLSVGPAKLQKAWKKLLMRWENASGQWHDAVSRDFEENYLNRLEPLIKSASDGMRAVAVTMHAAQQEFEQRD